MKTAEDHVLDIHGDNLPPEVLSEIVKHFKDYARDVSDQALQDASENLHDCHASLSGYRSNQKDILETEIKTP